MARILFVENSLRVDKLGIMYLSAILKAHGHETDLIQVSKEDINIRMTEYSPDFVMYSLMTGEHSWFININRELKKSFNFVSIFGGPHMTFFPESLENDEAVDHIVQGPAEEILIDLIEKKFPEKVIKGKISTSLDILPLPDRSILYKYEDFRSSGIRRFIASRDCKNACSYCFNHLFHRMFKDQKCGFFIHLSPTRLVDEILEVRSQYGLGMTYLNDDNLAEDSIWLENFCHEYYNRVFKPYNVPFCGSVRADSVNETSLLLMSLSGCSFLNIALESSVPETQRLLRRGRITNDDIRLACENCRKFNIKVRLQNMIGLPVENPLEDALATFEFNKELNPYDSWAAIFQPFPKTDLWKYCIEKNFIDKNDECQNFYDDTILHIKDAEKINTLHKWWHYAVRYNIPTDFLRLMLEITLTESQKYQIQKLRWNQSAGELYGDKK